jgi:hypothetical protein
MKTWFRLLAVSLMLTILGVSLNGCGGGGNYTPIILLPPAAPTDVVATPGDGSVVVSWKASSGATSYNIYYSTTPGVTKTTGNKIVNATTPYTVANLTNGTKYYFVVTALNASGESSESSEKSATPTPPPPRPTGITATGGDKKVTIGWTAVSGATSYTIYYSTTPGVTKTTGTKFANAVSPQDITGLTNGTTYYFVVTALIGASESDVSAEKSATPSSSSQPPAPPKGVSATPGNTQVTVSWTNSADATSYNIYYSTTPGVTKITGTKIANVVTPQIVPGLTNGTTYYFVVTAVNAAGESDISSESSATPSSSLQPPASPNGVVVTAGTGKITVQWNTKPTATSYNIYYKASSSTTTADVIATGTKVTVAAVSPDPQPATQSHDVSPLTAGTTYAIVVTAANAAGESGGQNSPKYATPN